MYNLTLSSPSGHISQPYYTGYSQRNVHCIWRITVPANHVIRLKILTFKLAEHVTCDQDYLQIKDGIEKSSPSLGRFCGYRFPTAVESSSNTMEIEYQRRTWGHKSWFKIYYFAKQSTLFPIL